MSHRPARIEDYGFLSDTQSGALVSRDGCVDWLCLPRFDSPACFASLLGEAKNGHWRFFPDDEDVQLQRRYRGDTLILETEIKTKGGTVRLIDFMPPRGTNPDLVRIVEGLDGEVSMHMELIIRFDYGLIIPWVQKANGGLEAIAGPDGLILRTPIETRGENLTTVANFTVKKGDRVPFVLTWFPSHELTPRPVDPEDALCDTEKFCTDWADRFVVDGHWSNEILRSLIT
jgi:GH15 family glucan-1,4-alpha-glucosidase